MGTMSQRKRKRILWLYDDPGGNPVFLKGQNKEVLLEGKNILTVQMRLSGNNFDQAIILMFS
jgi:hypothetical protein